MGHTWNLDTTYTFFCRSWAVGTQHTQFAMWTRDDSTGIWTHHITMDFPMGGQSFRYGLNSFLELWAGYDPAYRYVEFSNTWTRRLDGSWIQLRNMWTDGGYTNPPQGIVDQGGLAANAAYLRSGQGFGSNGTKSITAPVQPRPTFATAAVVSGGGTDYPTRGVFDVAWTLDPTRAPQYSYRIEIYPTSDASGTAIITRQAVAPHVHALSFTAAELAPGTYSARVSVTDILDQRAELFTFVFSRPVSSVTYLSDLPWVTSTNGWGPVERDRSNGETGAAYGRAITLGGVAYSKGLGCHATSDITWNLARAYQRLVSDIGVDDEVGGSGPVVFQAYRDGAIGFTSPVLTGDSATQSLDLDVRNVNQLRMRISDSGNGNGSDHADWAGAALVAYPCAMLAITSNPPAAATTPISTALQLNIATSGAAPTTYRWRHNGQPIKDTENATASSPTLLLSSPSLADEGSYDCFIANACSSVTSRACAVTVCIGDFDANGGVDGGDIEAFFLAWEHADLRADVNSDGGIDGGDIETFFTRWVGGC